MDILTGAINRRKIEDFLKAPSHSLVISAPAGFGKTDILNYISGALLEIDTDKLQQSAAYKLIEAEKSIGIDEIREVKKFLKLKQGIKDGRRVVAVNNCNLMTIEAQNSFLKMLEEPSDGTFFLMSAQNASILLPTIRSRVRILELSPYTKAELEEYFLPRGYKSADINRAFFMSGGLAAEMQRILDDDSESADFELAKSIISGSHYQRLLLVDSISKDKTQATEVLYAIRRTIHVALHAGNIANDKAEKLHRALVAVNESEQLIRSGSPNLKLLLSNLMLSL